MTHDTGANLIDKKLDYFYGPYRKDLLISAVRFQDFLPINIITISIS